VGLPGNGLAGVTVAIGAKTTVTDADGRFSIPGVTPPWPPSSRAPHRWPALPWLHPSHPTLVAVFFDGLAPPAPAWSREGLRRRSDPQRRRVHRRLRLTRDEQR
jgi:hypothetical protein